MSPQIPEPSFKPQDAQNQEPIIAQKELVTQIALADQRRRDQVEALHWDAEYNFWHRIISEEVERLRFNEGYEPVRIDLYPATEGKQGSIAFMGETQVGRTRFNAIGRWERDPLGRKVLRLSILKAK